MFFLHKYHTKQVLDIHRFRNKTHLIGEKHSWTPENYLFLCNCNQNERGRYIRKVNLVSPKLHSYILASGTQPKSFGKKLSTTQDT